MNGTKNTHKGIAHRTHTISFNVKYLKPRVELAGGNVTRCRVGSPGPPIHMRETTTNS